jgi:hypothetical protein
MNSVSSTPWTKTVEENKVKYKFFSEEQKDQPLINKVTIKSQYGMDKIVLTGQGTAAIYNLIKKSLDKKYTDIMGPISLVNKDIWISVRNIHSENPEALRPTLDKIYQVIESLFPHFNQLKDEIDTTIVSFGNKKGLNYFSKKSIDKSVVNFNRINQVNINFTDLDKLINSFKLSEKPIIENPISRKQYWLSYMEGKVRKFKSITRPNPLPCTGCWGVKQNTNCLQSFQIEKIKEDLSKLSIANSRFLVEYEEGDWGDWWDYPREKWSPNANTVRDLWGPIFLEQDKKSDDSENGFARSQSTSDRAIGRIIGFSCNDPNSPLSNIFFVKQRCESTSIAITLFAKEDKLNEFQEWLKSIGVLPLAEQPSFSFDDYLTKNLDKAGLYKPAAFYDSNRGIFGSIISENIERLRMVLTEYNYQIEDSFSYAFNNICNAQTGVAPFSLPD